jgi:hypothetical protein
MYPLAVDLRFAWLDAIEHGTGANQAFPYDSASFVALNL